MCVRGSSSLHSTGARWGQGRETSGAGWPRRLLQEGDLSWWGTQDTQDQSLTTGQVPKAMDTEAHSPRD